MTAGTPDPPIGADGDGSGVAGGQSDSDEEERNRLMLAKAQLHQAFVEQYDASGDEAAMEDGADGVDNSAADAQQELQDSEFSKSSKRSVYKSLIPCPCSPLMKIGSPNPSLRHSALMEWINISSSSKLPSSLLTTTFIL